MMRYQKMKLCVCCPFCSKCHERSSLADSVIICGRCGKKYGAIVSEDQVTTFPLQQITEDTATAENDN